MYSRSSIFKVKFTLNTKSSVINEKSIFFDLDQYLTINRIQNQLMTIYILYQNDIVQKK